MVGAYKIKMLLIASSFIKTIKDSVAVERHNNNISFDAKFTGFIGVGYLKLVREDKAMILPWLGPNHGSIHIKIATRTGGGLIHTTKC